MAVNSDWMTRFLSFLAHSFLIYPDWIQLSENGLEESVGYVLDMLSRATPLSSVFPYSARNGSTMDGTVSHVLYRNCTTCRND